MCTYPIQTATTIDISRNYGDDKYIEPGEINILQRHKRQIANIAEKKKQ